MYDERACEEIHFSLVSLPMEVAIGLTVTTVL